MEKRFNAELKGGDQAAKLNRYEGRKEIVSSEQPRCKLATPGSVEHADAALKPESPEASRAQSAIMLSLTPTPRRKVTR